MCGQSFIKLLISNYESSLSGLLHSGRHGDLKGIFVKFCLVDRPKRETNSENGNFMDEITPKTECVVIQIYDDSKSDSESIGTHEDDSNEEFSNIYRKMTRYISGFSLKVVFAENTHQVGKLL
jgi:copper oxidase (laccase) domain-containing protein